MTNSKSFRNLVLALPGVTEKPHFERTSFRVNKKIFATLDTKNNSANLLLSPIDQSVFSAFDNTIIYPVPNKWGKLGWTTIELKFIRSTMLKDAVNLAYERVTNGKPGKRTG